MIRVFVIARSEVIRAGLVSLLEQNSEIPLIVAGSGAHWDAPLRGDADVILADLEEPLGEETGERDGNEAIPVVVLTDESPIAALEEGSRYGVRAALPRAATTAEIAAALQAAAHGLVALPSASWPGNAPARRPTAAPGDAVREELTRRESEVLAMLAEGHSNKTIAWRLSISEHTVKFHISSIFAKLNASTRTEAVAIGVRQGLIML